MKKTRKTFLPEGYTLPTSSDNYFKFEKGKNKFRVLSSAVAGWQYWTEDKEVKRSKEKFEKLENIKKGEGQQHFWAFVVYNYDLEKIQILQITQKTIQKEIYKLIEDEDFGDPREYDLIVRKEGEGKTGTTYSIQAKDSDIDEDIIDEYEQLDVDLEKLFVEGGDPFGGAVEGEDEYEEDEEDDEDFEKAPKIKKRKVKK